MTSFYQIWEAKDMDLRSKISGILDRQQFSLFFSKGDSVFAAPEESRVAFARMKNPDKDTPPDWAAQANFVAINLDGISDGHATQFVFGLKDIPKITIIDQEKAVDGLMKKKKKK